MNECTDKLPLIDRVAEGEATPEEALELGRHLPGCTTCRIRLAKAHRLNEMVNELGEPVEVDESFLEQVMDSLPDGPPPGAGNGSGTRRSARHLRIVKILLTMSPLGLLSHGSRSLFLGFPGQISRLTGGDLHLPVEGGPDPFGLVREAAGIVLALAGKIGISSGDLVHVKPVFAAGFAAVSFLPVLAILFGACMLGYGIMSIMRRRSR